MGQYCTWGDWDNWGGCTTTCGSGGKRHRRRYLELSTNPKSKPPPPVEDMMSKYEKLFQHTKDLEENHHKELMVAFGAGSLSLIVFFVGMRVFSTVQSIKRGRFNESHSSRAFSRAVEAPHGGYDRLQSELPLMET